ncbi:uncharacterized protein AB675_3728 [Cyphellophora attinorum]|uniref:Uncharacterized protein n=1 Tax=Cyphellophora attinorum TaxID=1664694 RepID=A0A0N1NY74_9EURO|nr:uncharacterized protein AB675_3728 [Phialophora attinorum]KPI35225.1 hypothetical protein AB675_3728 [Phialophora attinorum]
MSGYAVATRRYGEATAYERSSTYLRNVRAKTWVFAVVLILLVGSTVVFRHEKPPEEENKPNEPAPPSLKTRPWKEFNKLQGFYQGIGNLVGANDFVPENPFIGSATSDSKDNNAPEDKRERGLPLELRPYRPQLKEDPAAAKEAGVPQHAANPLYGSYKAIGLRDDICFERYGRYAHYGLGYETSHGGTGLGMHGDRNQTQAIWATGSGYIDWREVDLGVAQQRCVERNQERFAPSTGEQQDRHVGSLVDLPDEQPSSPTTNPSHIPRTALVLRAWAGMEYTPALRLYLRSLVTELSLYSSGEYDVHLLIEVKDTKNYPIFTSREAYDAALAEFVPQEFRSMATLWSQDLMRLVYPGPFEPHFAEHGSMYPAMRSMHFALQWFMVQRREYEYFWNWEMDIRYVGHWYELLEGVVEFARKQRSGGGGRNRLLWDRSARFYVPALWEDDYGKMVEDADRRSPDADGTAGHSDDQEADYISLNPIFDPEGTLWNRRNDVSGWSTDQPIPERRSSIVVAARFSRRLLLIMHNETWVQRHSMGSEMFPVSVALHHGLKAVFAPHPVYMERDWPAEFTEGVLNGGGPGKWSGGFEDSVFGEGPHGFEDGLKESSYYYDSFWAGLLWRRWLGYKEREMESWEAEKGEGVGGEDAEWGAWGGRMCLRSMLFHPVKHDVGEVR